MNEAGSFDAKPGLHYGCVNCSEPIAETGLCARCTVADRTGYERGYLDGVTATTDRYERDRSKASLTFAQRPATEIVLACKAVASAAMWHPVDGYTVADEALAPLRALLVSRPEASTDADPVPFPGTKGQWAAIAEAFRWVLERIAADSKDADSRTLASAILNEPEYRTSEQASAIDGLRRERASR